MKKCILIFLMACCSITHAATFAPNTQYQVCFTPQKQCSWVIIHEINRAQKTIYVQAYSFTSTRIAKALVKAHERGVAVKIILDKINFDPQKYSVANYLRRHKIPIWRDDKLNIAHNKVMIFDKQTIETGSFNFTIAADKYNAENVLIIHSARLAAAYIKNWYKRQKASTFIGIK